MSVIYPLPGWSYLYQSQMHCYMSAWEMLSLCLKVVKNMSA